MTVDPTLPDIVEEPEDDDVYLPNPYDDNEEELETDDGEDVPDEVV